MDNTGINNQESLQPNRVIQGVTIFTLLQYYTVTSNPSVRSITTYYLDIAPAISKFSETILPMLFVFCILLCITLFKIRPIASLTFAMLPQVIYMALSAGWFLGGDNVNYAALGIHLVVTIQALLILWLVQNHVSTD